MMPAEPATLSLLSDLIRQRRSIKPFDMDPARPVGRDLLLQLLENANWAPTHGMTEPWRFTIFQGDARRDLSGAMQCIYRQTTPAVEFREEKLKKMSENPLLAPIVIVLWMARRGGAKIPEREEMAATACAAQNFFLSAHAAGLASYWSSPPLVYTNEFAQWLGLGGEDRCLGLFYLGWPKPGLRPAQGVRGAIDEKIEWR
jgi:nitroreductase